MFIWGIAIPNSSFLRGEPLSKAAIVSVERFLHASLSAECQLCVILTVCY